MEENKQLSEEVVNLLKFSKTEYEEVLQKIKLDPENTYSYLEHHKMTSGICQFLFQQKGVFIHEMDKTHTFQNQWFKTPFQIKTRYSAYTVEEKANVQSKIINSVELRIEKMSELLSNQPFC